MQTPVALIIFNRPDLTGRVFAEIAKAKPTRLFIVADGPRPDRPGEAEKCAAARAVVERIDWECEVVQNYSEQNMGCRRRMASGINWVFEQVEEAIILEDDCVPDFTFFRFCDELLEKYRDDERVVHIAGCNVYFGTAQTPYSYYFSQQSNTWGWATWRRAWRHYDVQMGQWAALRNTWWLRQVLGDWDAVAYWREIFDRTARGDIDTWDYQWLFTGWLRGGLAIIPSVNLISNVGFGADATHTKSADDLRAIPATRGMEFPLRHPPEVARQKDGDRRWVREIIAPTMPHGLYGKLRRRCVTMAACSPALRGIWMLAREVKQRCVSLISGSGGKFAQHG